MVNVLWSHPFQHLLPSCAKHPAEPLGDLPSLSSEAIEQTPMASIEQWLDQNNIGTTNLTGIIGILMFIYFYPHEGIAVFPKIQQEMPPARHPQRLPLQHRTLALCIDIASLWLDTWVQNHHSAGVPTQKMWIYSSYADCLNCCWMQTPLPMINGSKWSLTLLIHGI